MNNRSNSREESESKAERAISTLTDRHGKCYNANRYALYSNVDLVQKGDNGHNYSVSYKLVNIGNQRTWEFLGAEKLRRKR